MKCRSCGADVSRTANKCQKCGSALPTVAWHILPKAFVAVGVVAIIAVIVARMV